MCTCGADKHGYNPALHAVVLATISAAACTGLLYFPLWRLRLQEEVIQGGVLDLKQREDEERILRLEVAELERSIAATMKVRCIGAKLSTPVIGIRGAILLAFGSNPA